MIGCGAPPHGLLQKKSGAEAPPLCFFYVPPGGKAVSLAIRILSREFFARYSIE
jgi:hypothetical protein